MPVCALLLPTCNTAVSVLLLSHARMMSDCSFACVPCCALQVAAKLIPDTNAFLMTNDNAVVLFFRGTEPAKLVEWWSDAHVGPCPALPYPDLRHHAMPCPALLCPVPHYPAQNLHDLSVTALCAWHAFRLIKRQLTETSHPAQLCLQK